MASLGDASTQGAGTGAEPDLNANPINTSTADEGLDTLDSGNLSPRNLPSDDAFTTVVNPASSQDTVSIPNPPIKPRLVTISFEGDSSIAQQLGSPVSVSESKLQEGSEQASGKSTTHEGKNVEDAAASFGNSSPLSVEEGASLSPRMSYLTESVGDCSVKKALSVKSVRSIRHVGPLPVGTLRICDPSPIRNTDNVHPCMKSGDVFIVRDVPAGSIIGYDTAHLVVPANEVFDGIKCIPPGLHFLWGGSSTESGRNGFWILSERLGIEDFGEVHVKYWNRHDEILENQTSKAQYRIQQDEVSEIFGQLETYSNPTTLLEGIPSAVKLVAKNPSLWYHLICCIKNALLSKIMPHGWNQWQISTADDYAMSNEDNRETGRIPGQYEVLKFMFPKTTRTFFDYAIGSDRTEQAIDSTGWIKMVINDICTYQDFDEIIGELQFCFVSGMTLGNVACISHWCHIVRTILRGHKLVLENPVFLRKFFEAVHAQMIFNEEGIEGDVFEYESDMEQEMFRLMTIFKKRIGEILLGRGSKVCAEEKAAGDAFHDLESYLWKRGWDLRGLGHKLRSGRVQLEDGEYVDAVDETWDAEEDQGEYAPAIVQLDEDGLELDRIHI